MNDHTRDRLLWLAWYVILMHALWAGYALITAVL